MMLRWGLGRRIGLLPAMKAHDAFALTRNVVVPSRAEAMPYIVLEALAARKPVIASRVGGIPEVLGPNSIALAEPGDADALARVMVNAVSDPGWFAKVMPESTAFKQTFSASVMSTSLLRLYRDILATQSGGNRHAS
jgi:glycosyltransferase involved in cell wall biosynthesis